MMWNKKGDLVLGYFGVLLGIFASGWFIKIAMLMEDPLIILVCVAVGCLFLIEIIVSCMLLLGVYERDWDKHLQNGDVVDDRKRG